MNKSRRKSVSDVLVALSSISYDLECIKSEEEEFLENFPESFRYSERGESLQDAFDSLDQACSLLSEVSYLLDDLI